MIEEEYKNWRYLQVAENYRLYYELGLIEDGDDPVGFDYYGVNETTPGAPERIFKGWASFDGVRHIHFGDTSEDYRGYINYPDIQKISLMFQALSRLEVKYCREIEP